MAKELPTNWVETDLNTILVRITNGSSLKQNEIEVENSYPITRIETIAGEEVNLDRVKYVVPEEKDIEKFKLIKGDILFSHINSDKHLGKTALFDEDRIVLHGINLLLMRTVDEYNSKLLNYLFRYYRFRGKFIDVAQRAVNQSSINQKKLKAFPILLPPINEQERIVAKLDSLFTRLDKIKASLAKIPKLLQNFRQQVLTQAVTGKLTEEWRESKELEMREKLKIKSFTSKVGSGSTPKGGSAAYKSTGTPLIRSMNVHFSGMKYKGMAFIDEKQANKLKNVIVEENDILLNITGASIGRVCLAPKKMEGARVNQHVAIVRICEKVLPKFLNYYLASRIIQDFIFRENYGVTRQALTKTQLLNIEVNVPSKKEQQEIVNRVESLFSKADKIQQKYELLKTKVEQLPQAILHKAFKGELVPQLESDGDARELLREIEGLKNKL